MEYISEHLAQGLVVIGLILLAVEILVLGLSVFVLFFLGIGAMLTGGLMVAGILPETVLVAFLATAIISALTALVSWRPLQAMQNKVEKKAVKSDFIGHRFTLAEELPLGQSIIYRYSGIDWKVKSELAIALGDEVEITAVEVGLFTVKPITSVSAG